MEFKSVSSVSMEGHVTFVGKNQGKIPSSSGFYRDVTAIPRSILLQAR